MRCNSFQGIVEKYGKEYKYDKTIWPFGPRTARTCSQRLPPKEVYKFQKEQLAQMDRDCETMLTQAEQAFAEECFNLILDAKEAQTQYAYRRGLTDSVQLLKWLGVLAWLA